MPDPFDPNNNCIKSRERIGYVRRRGADPQIYADLGFKSGLEIHQQLLTEEKLFCRCPAGLYQHGKYDAELVRHMRPTLSELGEYDGTALMEFKTKKNIIYRIKNETACTYDIDDTPPFPINRDALAIAVRIALLLLTNIVGELHITRKQYLDGSIPTGFQRTAIVGIEGEIPLRSKIVRIIFLSVEEESCREVSDVGHERTYTTDRLGMPLIEMTTYPELLTPDEVAEAGNYLRYLTRSTGQVRTGIGAARQDVNVSITGGTRVEIKGVAHIKWIPELVHNEAFRQKALLEISSDLQTRIPDPEKWEISSVDLHHNVITSDYEPVRNAIRNGQKVVAVNLPQFKGLLSFFTQPGWMFADELSGRLKVIACLDQPNILHSEQPDPVLNDSELVTIRELLKAGDNDAQLVFWGAEQDIVTGLDVIQERCRMAMQGVPNETRKSMPDGTTIFERVLPGADRMYPDTDSAPIPLTPDFIEECRRDLPSPVSERMEQLVHWGVPDDCHPYILRRDLIPVIEKIVDVFGEEARFVATVLGHDLRSLEGRLQPSSRFGYNKVYGLFKFVHQRKLEREIVRAMLPALYLHPNMEFESVLTVIGYQKRTRGEILELLPPLRKKFDEIGKSSDPEARLRWVMGNLRKAALGNIPLRELRSLVEKGSAS
jgi:glutamyl-tRNA(Gln) amidotransferase subunit E